MPITRRLAVPLAFAALAATGAPAGATVVPRPPMDLPSPGAHAAGTGAGWLVGARPGGQTAAIAARLRARKVGEAGTYAVRAGDARRFAAALRAAGRLVFAEPDRTLRRAAATDDNPDGWARGAVATSGLAVPPLDRAPLAVIDDRVDDSHPDLAGQVRFLNDEPLAGPHGTMVASAAAAARQGSGVMGVFPGARVLSFGVPAQFRCSNSVSGIRAAVRAGARVINMSYGHRGVCFSEYVELQFALARGVLAVAATGNEFEQGNPVLFPAALPHVLSVAATGPDWRPAFFSSSNAAVDVSAPGQAVPVAVPAAFDTDGTPDGLTRADGTSFAAPIVAGAAAFLLAARPQLAGPDAAELLRRTARDTGAPGWDRDTGYGVVNLDAALAAPEPFSDPAEPNDEIVWVDGRAFGRPDRYAWRGFASGLVRATIDQVEDPLDVYRFRMPARSRVTVTVTPAFGDPDLAVFDGTARSTHERGTLIGTSERAGSRPEAVHLVNRSRRAQRGYVAVGIPDGVSGLSAGYALRFKRRSLR